LTGKIEVRIRIHLSRRSVAIGRNELSDGGWEVLKGKLPYQPVTSGKATEDRLFLNAILFVADGSAVAGLAATL
jgi:hypothetical protein